MMTEKEFYNMREAVRQVAAWVDGKCLTCGSNLNSTMYTCQGHFGEWKASDAGIIADSLIHSYPLSEMRSGTVPIQRQLLVRELTEKRAEPPASTPSTPSTPQQGPLEGEALRALREVAPRLAGVQIGTLSYRDQQLWREVVSRLVSVCRSR